MKSQWCLTSILPNRIRWQYGVLVSFETIVALLISAVGVAESLETPSVSITCW
jgi:hypothetical protein